MSLLSDFMSSGEGDIVYDLEKKIFTASGDFTATKDCVLIGYIYGGAGGGGGGGGRGTGSGHTDGGTGSGGGTSVLRINGSTLITAYGGRGGTGGETRQGGTDEGCILGQGSNGAPATPPVVTDITKILDLEMNGSTPNSGGGGGSCHMSASYVYYGGSGGSGSKGAQKEFAVAIKAGDVVSITIGSGGAGGSAGVGSTANGERGGRGSNGRCEFDVYDYWI